jgi:hypothetical protein
MTLVTSLAFGLKLKRARRGAHLTQAQLGERAGFSVVACIASLVRAGYLARLRPPLRHRKQAGLVLLQPALAHERVRRALQHALLASTALPVPGDVTHQPPNRPQTKEQRQRLRFSRQQREVGGVAPTERLHDTPLGAAAEQLRIPS